MHEKYLLFQGQVLSCSPSSVGVKWEKASFTPAHSSLVPRHTHHKKQRPLQLAAKTEQASTPSHKIESLVGFGDTLPYEDTDKTTF